MPYTETQMTAIRAIDLLTYFQKHEPDGVCRSGANEWSLIEHDSLKISNGKWHWFSRGIGGRSALDYLTKVRGMDFKTAAEVLSGDIIAIPARPSARPPDEPKEFALPPASVTVCHAADYLLKRGIDSGISRLHIFLLRR